MSLRADKEDLKTDLQATMLRRFLQHASRYRFKEEFVKFCVKKVQFTGKDEDVVLRKDFIAAFEEHSGVTFLCNKSFVQHLVAAGVRVIRVTRHRAKEYCYVGLRLADGEGRGSADVTGATGKKDANTTVKIRRNAAKNTPLAALTPSATSSADTSKETQPLTAIQKLMNYQALHKERDAFIEFCREKIRFTSDLSDFIYRKDLIEEFTEFLGGGKPCPIAVGRHLVSAGVMVTRRGSGKNREYGYRGICFADGRGHRTARVGAPGTRRKSKTASKQRKKKIEKATGTDPRNPTTSQESNIDQPHSTSSPSFNSFLSTSSPTYCQASDSTPLDLSINSAPHDLSKSASHTPHNQHHQDIPNSHLPVASPFCCPSLLSPLLAISSPSTPQPGYPISSPTLANHHDGLPQPTPPPTPIYSPRGTIRLLQCALEYLTTQGLQ